MVLTDDDLYKIKHSFDDRYDQIDVHFNVSDRKIDTEVEKLARATAAQSEVIEHRLDAINERLDVIHEDLADIKAVVGGAQPGSQALMGLQSRTGRCGAPRAQLS